MNLPASNLVEFTVSELSFALKRTVEDNFEHVRVRGEVSGFKGAAGSGHCYFRLKDERACLEAVIWRSTLLRLRFKPQEGLEVVATGKLTTFPNRSSYQIVVESLEPAGAGALMALLEERRRKLQAEGLFDSARKKPLPYLPRVIGVVTSPTGAVIRDILHRLRDRFPCRVLVWPVRVQGEGAAEEVAAAVHGFNAMAAGGGLPRPDLIIVARGGGSIEDLWAFNEEVAVRAVAASRIPTIAAVGHETDWTLIDHAADLRAPTPTGAAEMAVPVRAELAASLRELTSRHELGLRRSLEAERRHYVVLCRALPSLGDLLGLPRQRLDDAGGRLQRAVRADVMSRRERFRGAAGRLSPLILARGAGQRRERLAAAAARLRTAQASGVRHTRRDLVRVAGRLDPGILGRSVARHRERWQQSCRLFLRLKETLSPEAILGQGYAIVMDDAGAVVRSRDEVRPGDRLAIRLAQGSIEASVSAGGASARAPRPRKRVQTADAFQERLL